MPNPFLKDFGVEEEQQLQNAQQNPFLSDFIEEPEVSTSAEPTDSFPEQDFQNMVVDGINTEIGEPAEPEAGSREIAKGIIGGAIELTPLTFGARLSGELVTSLTDTESRYAVQPAKGDYSLVDGMVHPVLDEYQAAKFNESALNAKYQEGITEMREAVSDFIVDLVPSLIDEDWKPKVQTVAERRGQEMVEGYTMIPAQIMFFVPTVIGGAVSDATGDKFLGKTAELAAFGGVIKGLHTRSEYKAAQKMNRLKRAYTDYEPEGWLITEETPKETVLANEEGNVVTVKKGQSETAEQHNIEKARQTKSNENKNILVRASETLRKKSQEERIAIEAMEAAVDIYEGPEQAEMRRLLNDAKRKMAVPETPTPEEPQPLPPPRRTKGAPRKGMAKGVYRFKGGKVFDPEGYLVAEKLTVSAGRDMVKRLNGSEGFTKKAKPGFQRFDKAVVDRSIDFDAEIQRVGNKGLSYEQMINRLREVYYNLPEETRRNYKQRYNELLGKLHSFEKGTRRPVSPIGESKVTVVRPDDGSVPIAVDQRVGGLRQEPKPPKKARKPKAAKIVDDAEVIEAYNKAFGPGHVIRHTKMREGGNDILTYPDELGRSAMIDNDGNMIVGKGSADAHRMLIQEIPEDMRSFYERNRKTHQGWADEHDRFISIGDIDAAKGDVAQAYRNRYGEQKPTGEAAMKTGPTDPAAFTGNQAAEYAKNLDFSSSAEWNMTKDVNGFKVHIKKTKGKEKAVIKVDGFKIKGTKPKSVVQAILRGLDNESGQAYILNHIAFSLSNSLKSLKEVGRYVEDELLRRFSPSKRGKAARATAGSIRHINAKMDIANERLAGALQATRSHMSRWTKEQSMEFIDNLENGNHQLQATPELQKLSKQLRDALDANWEEVLRLGGHDVVLENYFPHYWDMNEGIIARIKARRPITGTKRFQKGRKYTTFRDGVDAGLTPLSWNPIDHFLWKMQETNKFIAGQTIWNELRASGHVRFFKANAEIPHGWIELKDPIARVRQFDARNKAFIDRGAYFAPDPVATIFNNYLEPGFYGTNSVMYRAFRYGNNLMNMAQLGLSAFHFMFTGLDSIASSVTTGVELMQGGAVAEGAVKSVLGILPTKPITAFIKGSRLRKALYKLDPINASEIEFVTRLEESGGGVHLEKYYDLGAIKRMKDAFSEGKYITGGLKFPAAAIEYSSRWIMSHWVPNLKLAMAFDQFMMQNKIWELKGIEPTLEQRRTAYGAQWDSIDNRMGQLRYDNLFINRKLKDSGMIFYRALGWNIGSFREFVGGALDIPESVRLGVERLTKGEKPDFASGQSYLSRRTIYTGVLLGVVIPAYTLALEWMLTGRDIKDIVSDEDWHPWYAKTGKIKPNGEMERVSLASYAKDVTSYLKDFPRGLVSTTGHKISPLLHFLYGALENRRFNGEIIYDWDKTFLQNSGGMASYVFEHFLPFSFRNIQMRREAGGRYYTGLESLYEVSAEDVRTFFGVVPAPAYATRTAAESKAAELASRRWPQGPVTHEEIERRKKKSKFIAAYLTENEAMVDSIIESGEFTNSQLKEAVKRAKTPRLALWIMALPIDDVMKVIKLAGYEELVSMKDILYRKFKNNRSVPKDVLQKRWDEYQLILEQKKWRGRK